MEIIRGNEMPVDCVLTIGKFESIHLGHQALIKEVIFHAGQNELVSAVMFFDPHPYVVLGDSEYKPLLTEIERSYLLENLGLDYLLVRPFDRDFAALSPETFCDEIFCDYKARVVIVGEGYRFGYQREGTVSLLQERAKVFGAVVKIVPSVDRWEKGKVSTSHIRNLLTANELSEVQQLLGFPFFVMGVTQRGRQLGRELGFPTLNIYPNGKFLPEDGVYVTLTDIDGIPYPGVTNIGLRPTVSPHSKTRSVETHLLDFPEKVASQEFYGQHIKTEFLHFIRPERKFASLEDLKTQLIIDVKTANCISTET